MGQLPFLGCGTFEFGCVIAVTQSRDCRQHLSGLLPWDILCEPRMTLMDIFYSIDANNTVDYLSRLCNRC